MGVERDKVTLAYALPAALKSWPSVVVQQVDVLVQVRHHPGEEPPETQFADSAGTALPALLL